MEHGGARVPSINFPRLLRAFFVVCALYSPTYSRAYERLLRGIGFPFSVKTPFSEARPRAAVCVLYIYNRDGASARFSGAVGRLIYKEIFIAMRGGFLHGLDDCKTQIALKENKSFRIVYY